MSGVIREQRGEYRQESREGESRNKKKNIGFTDVNRQGNIDIKRRDTGEREQQDDVRETHGGSE